MRAKHAPVLASQPVCTLSCSCPDSNRNPKSHHTFRKQTLAPRLAGRTKPHTPCENLPLGRLSRTSLQVWPHTCNVQGKVRTTLAADGEEKTLCPENEETRSEWELGLHSPLFWANLTETVSMVEHDTVAV